MTTETRSRAVVSALVGAGLIEASRHDEADTVVRDVLDHNRSAAAAPLRRRMAEIAGYVGGAFVVGAAALFFGTTWDQLAIGEQSAILIGIAVLLAGAAVGLVMGAGSPAALRAPEESIRLRLTSVLLTGAAASAAFGVGVLVGDAIANEGLSVMMTALLAFVLMIGGYRIAPTTAGQVGAAIAAFLAIPSGLSALESESSSSVPLGLLVLALGAAWIVAAERGLWDEVLSARAIGTALALIGAQIPIFDTNAWVGYVATAAVGAVAFWLYVGTRAWPYLAAGVVALTLAVPQALNDWAGGSLGAAGILLATGVTLLVAALLGLRLHHEGRHDHAMPAH